LHSCTKPAVNFDFPFQFSEFLRELLVFQHSFLEETDGDLDLLLKPARRQQISAGRLVVAVLDLVGLARADA